MTHDRGWRALTWVLHRRQSVLTDLLEHRELGRHWRDLALLMCAGAAVYGAVLGQWHGTRLALYVSAKLPLVLLLTSTFTVAFHWVVAVVAGVPLRFGQVAVLTFLGLAVGSVLLASLAPVAWLFMFSAPEPSGSERTAHNLLYLMHTSFVGVSGLVGTQALWEALKSTNTPLRARRGVYALWVLSYAFVGGEVAWALRPFVGSVYHPVVFLRNDALRGNVYEFIWTDIRPHLRSRLQP